MAERVYVALDLETTGLDAARDSIIEVGAVRFQGDRILDRFATLVNPLRSIPLRITQITGIRTADVAGAPTIEQVLPELLAFVGSEVAAVVAHNVSFDLGFLRTAGVNFGRPAYDTFELATILLPGMASYNLGELCRSLSITLVDAHRALDDAEASARLFWRMQERARALSASTLKLILTGARDVEWPCTQFFADAAAANVPIQVDAVPVAADAPRPDDHSIVPETADDGATTPVSVDVVSGLFAADSPLATLMGDTFEVRSGQIEMATQVMKALNEGDHLLIEAGTGTGKSLAYLLPAALWTITNHQRTVIATNTIALQDQLLSKDIPQLQALLAAAGYPIPQAALLKGRQNYICTRRLHAWHTGKRLTSQELTLLAKVLVWLPTTRTGDVSEIFLFGPVEKALWTRICSDAATCSEERCGEHDFYVQARRRAESAHLLVVNHALLLADLVADGRVLPPYAHLIVDETHRLEEAATDQLTFRVEWPLVQTTLRRISTDGDLAAQVQRTAAERRLVPVLELLPTIAAGAQRTGVRMGEFAERLTAFARSRDELRQEAGYSQRLALDGALRSQPAWSQVEIEWDHAGSHLRSLVEAMAVMVQQLDEARWWQAEPGAALLSEVRATHDALAELARRLDDIVLHPGGSHSDSVAWMEVNDSASGVVLATAPLAVNDLIEHGLVHARRSAIFTGATLRTGSGFRFIRERLGLWDVNIATVESPFDYRRSTLLYLPSDMPLPNQPHYQQSVEQAVIEAAHASSGRTLVLFTSYQQLRATADAIRAPLDKLGITVLQHGQSSRQRLLREYRETEKAVLLGTRSFWEGIDLPGDELCCLLIARLPFAVPSDPLVAARSAEFEDPFQDFTVPDAVLRFRQGFGRLIRRTTDRGVVVVLDSRVWRKEYGQAFLDALPECTVRRAPLPNLGGAIKTWLEQ